MARELLSRRAQDALNEAARKVAEEMLRELQWCGRELEHAGRGAFLPKTEHSGSVCHFCRANKEGGHYAHCKLGNLLAAAPAPSAPATAGAEPNDKAGAECGNREVRVGAEGADSGSAPAASPPPAPQVAAEALYVHVMPLKLAPRWDHYGVPPAMSAGWPDGERVAGVSLLAHMVEEVERERDEARAELAQEDNPAAVFSRAYWRREAEKLRALSAAAPPTRGEGVQEGVDRARLALALDDLVSAGGNGASVLHALDNYLLSRRSP